MTRSKMSKRYWIAFSFLYFLFIYLLHASCGIYMFFNPGVAIIGSWSRQRLCKSSCPGWRR